MFWLGWLLCCGVAVGTLPAVYALWRNQLTTARLQRGSSQAQADIADAQISVSVIVPARNEEQQIYKALQTILQSRDVQLQVIAVNDRSTDNTGALMDSVAADDARVTVVHISADPVGWLGKNHAMHVAARQATGDLLLFTDGDVIFEPDAIGTAARFLRQQQLDHFCLLPRMIPGGVIENAVVAFFGMMFAVGMQMHLIRTRIPFFYAGVGAFNLIDAHFYRAMGGHQPIAMDVLDDVMLGRLVKRSGGTQDFFSAPELLSIRWQPSLWGIVTGLEKNAFATLQYSLLLVGLATGVFFTTMVAPYFIVGLFPLSDSIGFLATILIWHSVYTVASIVSGGGWYLAPLFPVAAWIIAFTFWRSTWLTMIRGGVRWRDSFYSLKQLKATRYR